MSESDPEAGENVLLLNPAAVQVERADETVRPTRFGTVAFGFVHGGGPLVVTVTTAVATRQPIPPVTTENGAPNACATRPASSSPSCGPPMKKTMFTPTMRPRIASGVSS